MKYSDYSVRDFIQDEYFQNWVFHNDESVNSFWEGWLRDHPDKLAEVKNARQLLESIRFEHYKLPAKDVAEIWSNIHKSSASKGHKRSPGQSKTWFVSIAASVAMAIIAAVFYYYRENQPWKEYHTAFGVTSSIILPDGSHVVLNANSTITLYKNWKVSKVREIWIDGEAYFDVVHTQDNQPFKVHTEQGVSVEVLGTTFDVYNRTNATKVVLNSGSIRLSLPTQTSADPIMMSPGDMVEYKSEQYQKREVNPQLYTAWTNNKIILDHTRLEDMIFMMRDAYGLDVDVDNNTLLQQTVSGSMPLGNGEELLQQMASVFQLTVEKDGDRFILTEKK